MAKKSRRKVGAKERLEQTVEERPARKAKCEEKAQTAEPAVIVLPSITSISDPALVVAEQRVHIPDWVLGANDEIAMTLGQLFQESPGLRAVEELLVQAKRGLTRDSLWLFRDTAAGIFEHSEFSAKALLDGRRSSFGRVDKAWTKLLDSPQDASALLLGGDQELRDVFESHNWRVEQVTPDSPEFDVLLTSARRQDRPRSLTGAAGRCPEFDTVYVDNVFATLWGLPGQGEADEDVPHFSPPLGPFLPAPRTDVAEGNLQRFREMLYVAIVHLRDSGALIVRWQGLPYHPALMFVTAQLRIAFKAVSLLIAEEAKGFVLHVLATGHQKGQADDFNSGSSRLRYFLAGSQRSLGCDDALCWSLPQKMLRAEYKVGKENYELLWKQLHLHARHTLKDAFASQKARLKKEKSMTRSTSRKRAGMGDTLRDFWRREAKAKQDGKQDTQSETLKLPAVA